MQSGKMTGITLALGSTFLLALSHIIAKLLSEDYHPIVIAFLRNLVTLVMIVGWAVLARKTDLFKTQNLKAQISRGLVGSVGLVFVVSAYAALSVSDITAVLNTSPLFAVVLAFFFLGEPLGWKRGVALLVGFIGALLIIQPSGALTGSGLLLAISASLAIATQTIIVRYLGRTDHTVTTVFYTALTGAGLTAFAVPFFWTGWSDQLGWLVLGLGTVGLLAQLTRTQCLRLLPVSLTEILGYSFFLWSLLLGFMIWRNTPTPHMLIGSAIVIAASLLIVRMEQKGQPKL